MINPRPHRRKFAALAGGLLAVGVGIAASRPLLAVFGVLAAAAGTGQLVTYCNHDKATCDYCRAIHEGVADD